MTSISFPEIFSNISTKMYSDHQATKSNLKLILATELGTLYGDPGYGCGLQKFLFEQNNLIIKDLIVDRIYDVIKTYIPQLQCARKDIVVYRQGTEILVDITATNLIDYQIDLYTIKLMDVQ